MNVVDRAVAWGRARPPLVGELSADAAALSAWHEASVDFLMVMAGQAQEAVVARAEWRKHVRGVHAPFVRRHREAIHGFMRSPELAGSMCEVSEALPGLMATRQELTEDAERRLPEKIGVEYKTAVLLSTLLETPCLGELLMAAARQPLPRSLEYLRRFERDNRVELRGARIGRDGSVAIVEISSPDALNSEDESVLEALETCVDIALSDERIEVGVLRGAPVQNAKHLGRRIFCSGINLSELYHGKISYLYYVRRELGLISKIYRGLRVDAHPYEIEKPWIMAVDRHAIGGGCQLLLVADYIIAERGSVLSLPANREGILPGAANLRLSRFVGNRAARRTLLMGAPIAPESDEGRLLVDEVVAGKDMDVAIRKAAESLSSSWLVSLASNRKALRFAHESINSFREYMAYFALAQADCHFSANLVRNLEQHWMNDRAGRDTSLQAHRSPS